MKQRFRVGGMSCAACSAHVEKSVRAVPGVSEVQVNLLAGSMTVAYDETVCDAQRIIRAVEEGGYTAAVDDGLRRAAPQNAPQAEDELKEMKTRILVSAVFLVILMYFSMGPMIGLPLPGFVSGTEHAFALALVQLLLTLPICIINRKYYINGFKTLLHRAPTMDALIAVGSGAALIYGVYALFQIGYAGAAGNDELVHSFAHDLYFESAGMILTLVTLGKFFEARAKRKTGEAIAALMDLRPQTANVLRGGQELSEGLTPSWFGHRQRHMRCTCGVSLRFCPEGAAEAGLTVYAAPRYHFDLAVRRDGGIPVVELRQTVGEYLSAVTARVALPEGPVRLIVEAMPTEYRFFVQTQTGTTELGRAETKLVSNETAKLFTGVFFALYCSDPAQKALARFSDFTCTPNEN